MKVELEPGEKVAVTLSGTDGVITVSYDGDGDSKLTVHADLPDTSGREGIIYEEDFGSVDFGVKEEDGEVVDSYSDEEWEQVLNSQEEGRDLLSRPYTDDHPELKSNPEDLILQLRQEVHNLANRCQAAEMLIHEARHLFHSVDRVGSGLSVEVGASISSFLNEEKNFRAAYQKK